MNKQIPISEDYDRHATASEVIKGVDLLGKTVIVTGGYSGLGLETVRVMARRGAKIIVPARSIEKAHAALRGLPNVHVAPLDLMSKSSIDNFSDDFLEKHSTLHLLINNAGIMATPLVRDSRGYESQFSSNHLGHFQLTNRLLPALQASENARVVNLSSRGHQFSGVDFEDPNFEKREYDKWKAYGQSKSANILFTVALDERTKAHGVRSFAVHPGRIMDTDLIRHLSSDDLRAAGVLDSKNQLNKTGGKTIEQGAATIVWCAVSPRLRGLGGVYCEDLNIAKVNDTDLPSTDGVKPWAINEKFAERLWHLSEKLTGLTSSI